VAVPQNAIITDDSSTAVGGLEVSSTEKPVDDAFFAIAVVIGDHVRRLSLDKRRREDSMLTSPASKGPITRATLATAQRNDPMPPSVGCDELALRRLMFGNTAG
jgi:hypothetical protein